MNKQDKNQLERKLRMMRFAPWCVLAAVTLIVVPEYLDANDATTHLAGQLIEAEELPGELASMQQILEAEQERAEHLTNSLVPAEKTHAFHNRIVEIARTSGCKVRRMTEGARNSKPWVLGQPIVRTGGIPAGTAPPQGGLKLETLEMKVELTGTLPQLKLFLEGFKKTEAFVHTRAFSLSQPRGQNAKLEINLILLNLTHAKTDQNA
jgi:hypothetical protein